MQRTPRDIRAELASLLPRFDWTARTDGDPASHGRRVVATGRIVRNRQLVCRLKVACPGPVGGFFSANIDVPVDVVSTSYRGLGELIRRLREQIRRRQGWLETAADALGIPGEPLEKAAGPIDPMALSALLAEWNGEADERQRQEGEPPDDEARAWWDDGYAAGVLAAVHDLEEVYHGARPHEVLADEPDGEIESLELADARPARLEPGTRVRRGPDWKWGDQDAGLGTVILTDDEGWVLVRWDRSPYLNKYRWHATDREPGKYDLEIVPSLLTERRIGFLQTLKAREEQQRARDKQIQRYLRIAWDCVQTLHAGVSEPRVKGYGLVEMLRANRFVSTYVDPQGVRHHHLSDADVAGLYASLHSPVVVSRG